ncbi:MAG: phosphatidate cytidylyltransferase [Planctomycetota bacterium]|jgi:phosphatidate cytidylyltransferase
MRQNRILVGALATVLVTAVFGLDYFILNWLPSAALLSVVAFVASYELCRVLEAAGLRTYPALTAFSAFVVAITPAAVGVIFPTTPGTTAKVSSFALQAGFIFLFVILTFVIALTRKNPNAGVKAVVSGTFVLVYIGFALSFLVRLRGLPDVGWALLLFAVGCGKSGDVGAYFVGRTVGRHPLAAGISPKKTVEGAFGALAASLVFAFIMSHFTGQRLGLYVLLPWAVVLSIAAQFGDLAESILKRAGQVKDSSAFFGSMGGVLDVVDSLLLCAPTAYILALAGGFGAR